MQIDRNKAIKLVIVLIATLAALAVTSTLVQLIQAVLPFLIVAAGVYVGYRWALDDSEAPTADEMEEQARGLFSRFRRTKDAVETTVKVGSMFNNLTGNNDDKKEKKKKSDVVEGEATTVKQETAPASPPPADPPPVEVEDVEEDVEEDEDDTANKVSEMKRNIESNPEGKINFKDRDVVISKDDLVQPDISRLEEKEKEKPQVTNDVLAQIEERRRRLQQGGE